MKIKKLLVRIFNLVFLAGTAVAILGYLTKPIFDVNLKATIPADMLAEIIQEATGGGTEESTTKSYVYRDGGSEDSFNISDYLNAETIKNEVGDINIELAISIPAKAAFDLKNTEVLTDLISENVDGLIHNLTETLVPKVKSLVKGVTKNVAKDMITQQVKDQIKDNITGDADSVFNEHVDEAKIDKMVDDVYKLLDGNGQTTVSAIAEAIMGTPNEDGTYSEGLRGILTDLQGVEGFDVDPNSVKSEDIEEMMAEALGAVPGLTEEVPMVDEAGNPIIDQETGEQKTEIKVNNIDDAILALLDMIAGSSETDKTNEEPHETQEGEKDAIIQENVENEKEPPLPPIEEGGEEKKVFHRHAPVQVFAEEEASEDELSAKIESLLKEKLPLDSLSLDGLSEDIKKIIPIALAGLIGLGIFPWALFALVTIFRTIRKRKCWTKPWIVFFFAFTQLILGVVLTIAVTKLQPMLMEMVGGNVPEQYAGLLGGLGITIKTSAYMASIIYLVFIPLTIVYMIFAHGVKKDYKQYKKDKKLAKKAAKAA